MKCLNLIYLIRTQSPFEEESLESLELVKIPYRLIRVREEKHKWAEAINRGLSKVDEGDVLIIEEDIVLTQVITPEDIPGDKIIWSGLLLTAKNHIGHGGALIDPATSDIHLINGPYDSLYTNYPREVDILSGSFLYVPEAAWQEVRPASLPGLGWEDIAWILAMRKAGFRAMILPIRLNHFCNPVRQVDSGVRQLIAANFDLIKRQL